MEGRRILMADKLVIKKEPFASDDCFRTLQVSNDIHAKVKNLADKSNLQINKVACMLVEFALEHVELSE